MSAFPGIYAKAEGGVAWGFLGEMKDIYTETYATSFARD